MTNKKQLPVPSGPEPLVWERPEPSSRAALEPLSRERIVRAAIALADADGLAAVSLRNVGAALNAGPMRLYGYMSTKEELLELMLDAVYGEMERVAPAVDWRVALREMAYALRAAAGRHKWFGELLGGRPSLGPHALAHLESTLAALDGQPGFGHIDAVMRAVRTLNAYVIGAIRAEDSQLRAMRESGMDKQAWQAATWPYLQRVIASGKFPTIAKLVLEAAQPSPDEIFEQSLECVLDGIAARIKHTK